ncbi:MAG: cadherin-like beta sandwich domain-containing protein [Herbinix sp.]|nr:cadherin-like beta sandwich domain-containing protein [Herbinix sp.]
MINRIKKYLGVFLLLLIAGSLITAKPCLAASAKVDLTSDNTEVTVGDTIHAYIKINSGTTFGAFEANLTYDDSILEYEGGAAVITGGNGFLKISDMDIAEVTTSRKYALEFKTLKVGECKLSFSDLMVYDESGNEMPVSSDELAIKVNAKETASADANLKSLITSPTDITPTFDKNILEYSVNVGNETEKLIITAIPEDNKANVSILGNDFLKEGENKIIITVLAESGDVIEYTINVFREYSPENVSGSDNVTVTPAAAQGSFEIVQSNGVKYAVFSGNYKLIEPGNEVVIPEGYNKTVVTITGISITAFVPNNDTESEFILIYAANSSGEEGFYQYDRIEKTLQRYVAGSGNSNVNNQSNDYRSKLNKAAVVIAALSALSILLISIVIWIFIKLKGDKKDDLE